jgi:hypothetical protein
MELAARKFTTFEEAEAADRAYYRALTPRRAAFDHDRFDLPRGRGCGFSAI